MQTAALIRLKQLLQQFHWAEVTLHSVVQESWYEKLNRWEEAYDAYERKYHKAHGTAAYVDAALGRLR